MYNVFLCDIICTMSGYVYYVDVHLNLKFSKTWCPVASILLGQGLEVKLAGCICTPVADNVQYYFS